MFVSTLNEQHSIFTCRYQLLIVPVIIAGYQIIPEFRGLRSPFSYADKILWVRSSGRIVGMACFCSSISGALSGKAKSLEVTQQLEAKII